MKPLRFEKVMTNEEAAKHSKGVNRVKKAVESLAKKRKSRIDDIMYNREIEAIHELYG